ncbi:WhiB family transcriptional regulator [Amycolatopsis acidicola]|uniref:WhiB family transcriptional regulator n=1 Tax=Amycolatopsis acidicola TaxID=2596893 RepID=A0A5N0VCI8_9PSEU|nr:WhiB family transcriptional regulator [Amycolatopsis acidicola]KAA9162601.1 WhiB family transcriptional regulator [Amycolatopsis acidicola]
MTDPEELRLVGIAWQLDRLRWVPTGALDALVRDDGLCFWACPDPVPEVANDRELAACFCAGCPVPDECLELELRTGGENTVGVWGAMPEDERRALRPHWLRRGERAGREE